jgi:hypothetical protein
VNRILVGQVFFITVFMNNVSFNAIANARDRSVGDVSMFSSISGSDSTDAGNIFPKY